MKEFIETVKNMRIMQREYFKRIATAKKSKLPEDFASAKRALELSKDFEAECDRMLMDIDNGKIKWS